MDTEVTDLKKGQNLLTELQTRFILVLSWKEESSGKLFEVFASGVEVNQAQALTIVEGVAAGVNTADTIFGESYSGKLWNYGPVRVRVDQSLDEALMNPGMYCSPKILGLSRETVTGATVHEMVESYREDRGLAGDEVPLAAEFLFCGDDRLPFFEGLTDDQSKSGDRLEKRGYKGAWKLIAPILVETAKWQDLVDFKQKLTKEQKVAEVRELLFWKAK